VQRASPTVEECRVQVTWTSEEQKWLRIAVQAKSLKFQPQVRVNNTSRITFSTLPPAIGLALGCLTVNEQQGSATSDIREKGERAGRTTERETHDGVALNGKTT
jgi:hypothetical protein